MISATHATLLLQPGVHPKVVQERLGHSSITFTLDSCSHVIPGVWVLSASRVTRMSRSPKADFGDSGPGDSFEGLGD